MDETPRSSFIPKQASSAMPSTMRKRRRYSMFNYTAGLLLLVSLFVGGGSYVYKGYVQKQLDAEKATLAQERDTFKEGDIESVREFDRRVRAAEYLLDARISPSKIFDALELTTLRRVQFTSFAFDQLPSGDVTLTIEGTTNEFEPVALQALQFNGSPLLNNAIFTKVAKEDTALNNTPQGSAGTSQKVSFSVTGSIAPALLAFQGIHDTSTFPEDASQPGLNTSTQTTPQTGSSTSGNNQTTTE